MNNVAIALMATALVAKLVAFSRDPVLAARFGATQQTDDAFLLMTTVYIAFNLVALPFQLGVQRQYAKWKLGGASRAAQLRAARAPVSVVSLSAAGASAIFMSGLLATGPSRDLLHVSVLVGLAALGAFFLALGGAAATFLASEGRFLGVGFVSILANGVVAAGVLLTPLSGQVETLPLIFTAGFAMQALPAVIFLKHTRVDERLRFEWREFVDPAYGGLLSAMFYQGGVVVLAILAMHLGSGTFTAVMYGNKVDMVIFEVVTLSLSTVFFPIFVRRAVGNPKDTSSVTAALQIVSRLIPPVAAVLVLGSEPIVRVLFARQAFGQEAASITTNALSIYALSLLPMAVVEMTSKSLIASRGGSRLLMPFGFGLSATIIASVALSQANGAYGLPWGFLIGVVLTGLLLWGMVFGPASRQMASNLLGRPVPSAILAAFPVWLFFQTTSSYELATDLLRLAGGGAIELVGYVSLLWVGGVSRRSDGLSPRVENIP